MGREQEWILSALFKETFAIPFICDAVSRRAGSGESLCRQLFFIAYLRISSNWYTCFCESSLNYLWCKSIHILEQQSKG